MAAVLIKAGTSFGATHPRKSAALVTRNAEACRERLLRSGPSPAMIKRAWGNCSTTDAKAVIPK